MAATLVPDWFSYVFPYKGDDHALEGLLQAVELVMANGFAVTGFLGLVLNLLLPDDPEDEAPVVESDDGSALADNEPDLGSSRDPAIKA